MRLNTKLSLNKSRIVILLIILIGIILLIKRLLITDKEIRIEIIENLKPVKEKLEIMKSPINLKLFDLTKPPASDEYKLIPCRLSKPIFGIVTTLCVHDLTKDSYVSSSIWANGVWEEDIVTNVLKYLSQNPDWLFLGV